MEAKKAAVSLQVPSDVWQRVCDQLTTREWVTPCGLVCKFFQQLHPLKLELANGQGKIHKAVPSNSDFGSVESAVRYTSVLKPWLPHLAVHIAQLISDVLMSKLRARWMLHHWMDARTIDLTLHPPVEDLPAQATVLLDLLGIRKQIRRTYEHFRCNLIFCASYCAYCTVLNWCLEPETVLSSGCAMLMTYAKKRSTRAESQACGHHSRVQE